MNIEIDILVEFTARPLSVWCMSCTPSFLAVKMRKYTFLNVCYEPVDGIFESEYVVSFFK